MTPSTSKRGRAWAPIASYTPLATTEAAAVLAKLVANPGVPMLTPAEREVLALVLDSRSNAEIAGLRARSLRTVANQITGLLRKFGVVSRTELVAVVARIVQGEPWFTEAQGNAAPVASVLSRLKPRQQLVMRLRARGHSIKYIGYELGVASSTASHDLKSAMNELQIRSCLELCTRFGTTDDC